MLLCWLLLSVCSLRAGECEGTDLVNMGMVGQQSPSGRTLPPTIALTSRAAHPSLVDIGSHTGEATGGPGFCLSGLQVPFKVFRDSHKAIIQHLVVQDYPSSLHFSFCGFSTTYAMRESRDSRATVARQPQPIAVSAGVKHKSSVFNKVHIILVIPHSLLPERSSTHNWSSARRISERGHGRRPIDAAVLGRPRHPLSRSPFLVTALKVMTFNGFSDSGAHGEFVSRKKDESKG